ncbi:MAG: hypothetical protein ACFFFH_12810 [Candidatus Thorarchaeota archaeon]
MIRPLKLIIILLIVLCLSIPIAACPSNHAIVSLKQPEFEKSIANTSLTALVVLMELPDDPHYHTHTLQYFEDLFFSTSSLSITQYFKNTSYGEVILEGEVLGWFQAKHNLSYYGAGKRLGGIQEVDSVFYGLADEARNHAIDAEKDPESYDLFIIIHSGDGQEYSGNSNDIWSHQGNYPIRYSMNHEFVNYVTPCHELGHSLYFPDLYDYVNNQKNIFAGPYDIMGEGEGHFSIWNKYYSKISLSQSVQFLSASNRLQISNYTSDTVVTINPLAINKPDNIMWLELGWNNSGFSNPNYGRGWTVSVREDLDYDAFLPKHGVVIAKIQVGPRSDIQVAMNVYPPWNVIDAHLETSGNKDDAAFSLADGDIGTFCSGEGWAIQLLEKFNNLSYSVCVTNENNIPQVEIDTPNHSIKGNYDLLVSVIAEPSINLSQTEISIDNGPWLKCTPIPDSEGKFSFLLNTMEIREGTHFIRARAITNTSIPYIGYSPFITVEVDNIIGSILVIDDDLGRSSETNILSALDELGYFGKYEIKRTTSMTEAEITAEEMRNYEAIIWVGNPSITPISNSHINYNEFQELKQYLESSDANYPSRIIFMSSYNIFDFSNQGTDTQDETDNFFRARSPTNFRAPVSLLHGINFLEELPLFTLGPTDSVRANRSNDGEVVTLLSGAVPILEDTNPEFQGYGTKAYYVDNGKYKLVNFLFQPELVPDSVLPQLLDLTLVYLSEPNNSTFTSIITTTSETTSSTSGIDLLFWVILALGLLSIIIPLRRIN